jgi:lipopolysaccharide/colanic/teichoic acid biosynthesis glycosyltransferase
VKNRAFLSGRRAHRNFVSQGGDESLPGISSLSTHRDNSRISIETEATGVRDEIPLWKRWLDLTLIFVSLPFWFVVLIMISTWIKLFSAGPLFFCQERVGYRGRRFTIFKFRTMETNVETRSHELHLQQLISSDCPMTKLDASGDPRIIFGGRILRATGLDELPQIFNVLRGEMSLVGPRPCTANEFKCYKTWQEERLDALPGLTGYWQVNGKNKTTFSEMIRMDIYYARNLSLRLDLAILVKTFPTILVQVLESRFLSFRRKLSSKTVSGKVAQLPSRSS